MLDRILYHGRLAHDESMDEPSPKGGFKEAFHGRDANDTKMRSIPAESFEFRRLRLREFNREFRNSHSAIAHSAMHTHNAHSKSTTVGTSPLRSRCLHNQLPMQACRQHADEISHRGSPITAAGAQIEFAGRILHGCGNFKTLSAAMQRQVKHEMADALAHPGGSLEPGHELTTMGGLQQYVAGVQLNHWADS
jgi:hypothetical protein